jgi:hemerythrin-like domain-containing protein
VKFIHEDREVAMSHQLDRWNSEHRNFARLLDAYEAQLALLRGDADPDYELMLEIMDYMTSYTDRVHHPTEDLCFAMLVEREPAVRPAVRELTRQHRQMAESGRILRAWLQAILNGTVAPRDAVEEFGRAYVDGFRRHMDLEYREVFPAAQRALTQHDWDDIDAAFAAGESDPLAAERLDQRYAALRREIAGARPG